MTSHLARIPALFVLLAALSTPGVAAQHFPSDAEITEILRERVESGRGVGIVVGVLEADGSRRIVSYGEAGPGARPLDGNSVFEIGSITKVFTGILLADMARDGRVSEDDPVQALLPDDRVTMPNRNGREIRLVDLATHRSALPRLPSNLAPSDVTNPYADYTVEMLYDFLSGYELPRDIGSEYEYSNLGVGLLGHALALRAGADYEALVKDRILDPLGMEMTGVALTPEMEAALVRGHNTAGAVVPFWDLPTLAGAGALRSTAHDMLTFLEANVGEPTTELERAMRSSHARRADAGQAGIGLNWIVQPVGEDRIIWHNGGTGGFRTWAGFDPGRGVAAVVLTNSTHGADDIGMHLVNPAVPLQVEEPRAEIEVGREILARYVGTYQLTPDFRIEVTLDEVGLGVQATGQPRLPIFPESETRFFLRDVNAQVTFVEEDGEIVALILHQGGADRRARRVEGDADEAARSLANPVWEPQFEDSTALFIGLAVVDEDVVWASGNGGRVARTVDGGATWDVMRVPGEEAAQFRDVHAVSADEAWVLSIPTPLSRIYHTTDGGGSWTRVYGADTDEIFLDCFAFWETGAGFVFGDSREGEFVVLRSDDGAAWSPVEPDALPDAREGEGGFAASGTCAVARPGGLGWFATGASGVDTRVMRTTDFGVGWTEAPTSLPSGSSSAGIFSLAFVDDRRGAAFGGDLAAPEATHRDVAWTEDGGASWTVVGSTGLRGAVYGAAAVPGASTPTLFAVSPDGSAWSVDGGRTWTRIDDRNAWTVAFHAPGVGWAAGQGHISRLRHRE